MQFLFILSNIRLTRLFLCFCVPDCTLQQLCWLSGSFSWFYFAPGLIDCCPAVFSGAEKDRWQRVFPFLNSLYLPPQTVRWALPACPVLPLSADCLLPHHSSPQQGRTSILTPPCQLVWKLRTFQQRQHDNSRQEVGLTDSAQKPDRQSVLLWQTGIA